MREGSVGRDRMRRWIRCLQHAAGGSEGLLEVTPKRANRFLPWRLCCNTLGEALKQDILLYQIAVVKCFNGETNAFLMNGVFRICIPLQKVKKSKWKTSPLPETIHLFTVLARFVGFQSLFSCAQRILSMGRYCATQRAAHCRRPNVHHEPRQCHHQGSSPRHSAASVEPCFFC